MGDLEEEGEAEVLHRFGGFVRSDLLKAGHHGSLTSSSEAFVNAVRPNGAVVSVGWNNTFGHPAPERISFFKHENIGTSLTSEEGAIWHSSDGTGWVRKRW
jgi:competence protein ComEC